MSVNPDDAAHTGDNSQSTSRSLGAAIWRRLLPRFESGRLTVELPSGRRLVLEGRRAGTEAQLTIRRWRGIIRLAAGGDVGFADAYVAGEFTSPDLSRLLTLAAQNWSPTTEPLHWRIPNLLLKLRHARNRNTLSGSRRNIEAHYDLGNDFFAHWLDPSMNYSSALFTAPGETLEAAQTAKLDRVIDLLDLENSAARVLEIGCGWGAFAERLLSRTDATLVGITISPQQFDYANERLRARGLAERAELRLQDYRELGEQFDRIVSIEMIEAVGEAYWPVYFRKIYDNLRPGGIAIIQAITIAPDRYDSYRRRPDFIQKYVFPGGMLPTVPILHEQIAASGLRLVSAETFAMSYARTLAEWQRRFQRAWPSIREGGFDERFKRIWEYYLAYCEAGFATGAIDVGHYTMLKPADAP